MAGMIVITGPMFAQKTGRLMQEIEDAVISGYDILVLRPELDDRESRNIFNKIRENPKTKDRIHINIFLKSIKDPRNIFELIQTHRPNLIVIDEVQFFPQSITGVLQEILDQHRNNDNFSIAVAGLDTDFRRELFGPTHAIMAMADKVIKSKAVCNKCRKKKAIFTWRSGDSTLQVVVGDAGLYEARCRKCYET